MKTASERQARLRPEATVVTVDPTTATHWLTRNSANRPVRHVVVSKYADDMTNGRWCLTGAPIQFAVDGTLLDGQHRLLAIIESGVTLPLFVVNGLPLEARPYMDVGTKRTLADQLGIAGYQHRATLAAGARLALAWATDRLMYRMENLSDAEVREFIEKNPTLLDAAEFAASVRLPITGSVVCAVTWRLTDAGHNRQRVHDFFQAIADMRSDGPGDPKYALLNRINRARRARERFKSTTVLSMVIRAYNADYLGTRIHRMQATTSNSLFVEVPGITAPVETSTP